jgi:hypothetical protein
MADASAHADHSEAPTFLPRGTTLSVTYAICPINMCGQVWTPAIKNGFKLATPYPEQRVPPARSAALQSDKFGYFAWGCFSKIYPRLNAGVATAGVGRASKTSAAWHYISWRLPAIHCETLQSAPSTAIRSPRRPWRAVRVERLRTPMSAILPESHTHAERELSTGDRIILASFGW